MKGSNYALITALYVNNMHRGLYSDIYFPIIRYAILKIFSNRGEEHPYSSANSIQEFIKERFGFTIPTVVIANAVRKIYNSNASSLVLKVFEKGNSFQIQQVSNDDSLDVDKAEKEFDFKEKDIEEKFEEYINLEGLFDDKITFVSFISSNTDNLLAFFETEDEKRVDEKYFTLVSFLKYLHESDAPLYDVANKFFWSSIIAAFLQSDKPSVNASEDNSKIEYYLDTPLIMGMLGLSTSEKEHYATELKETIKSAQGIMKVHPITLEEIKSILLSAEQNGINPFSDIADSMERNHLEINQLAKKRINLESEVENLGIDIYPRVGPGEIERIKKKYHGTEKVKELAKQRSRGIESYSHDGFREVHDIFMDDFIKQRRESKHDEKHVFFITNNIDLINLCKSFHKELNCMLSVSQLILELWIYNTKATGISDVALVEAMAKCIDAHKVDVKNKLVKVSKYYNKTKGKFDSDVYKDFVRHLYRRAKNVIMYVDSSDDIGVYNTEKWHAGLNTAMLKDIDAEKEHRVRLEKEKASLKAEVNDKADSLIAVENFNKQLQQEKQKLQTDNEKLQQAKTKLTEDAAKLQNDNKELKDINNSLTKRKNELEHQLSLRNNLEKLKEEQDYNKAELERLEKERKCSFTNWRLTLFTVLFFISLVLIVLDLTGVISVMNIAVLGPLGAGLLAASITFYKDPNVGKLQEKAYAKWEQKPENRKYGILKNNIKKMRSEIDDIQKELQTTNKE